ncbi:MAG: thiamine phosphate synthase [Acidobacteriia bacterium]|nr:thiamine phosphate synthase [Terriglobia bacterium]
MTLPRLYPILDTQTLINCGAGVELAAAAFLDGGAGILQFRHKGPWDRQTYHLVEAVARLCHDAKVPLIINDRADFAMLLHAGLHLGQDDLPPGDGRKLLGPQAMIGFSSHNPEQLCAAAAQPVDYVALGPVFPTYSKHKPDPIVGVPLVRHCRTLLEKPLVAIGGITMANAADVLRAGADSVAVIAGLLPETPTAESLTKRMDQWQRLVMSA